MVQHPRGATGWRQALDRLIEVVSVQAACHSPRCWRVERGERLVLRAALNDTPMAPAHMARDAEYPGAHWQARRIRVTRTMELEKCLLQQIARGAIPHGV